MNKSNHTYQLFDEGINNLRRALMGARERAIEGLQLTRTQLEIIHLLSESSQTTSELAKRLHFSQSAVTQTIDTLVRRNLVERHHDETDRRLIRLTLSSEGQTLINHLRAKRQAYIQALLGQLTTTEIDAFISVMQKLAAMLEDPQLQPQPTKEDE